MDKIKLIDLYKKESNDVFKSISSIKISKFVDMVFDVYENEGTIFAAGNGGNVASVQNLVVDLNMHRFVSEDKGSQTIDHYSLLGFTKAYSTAKKACS